MFSVLFVVLIAATIAGVAYYFGIYKPEHDSAIDKALNSATGQVSDTFKELTGQW